MKWQINLENKNFIVDLPDAMPTGRTFIATIADKNYECTWNRANSTLSVKTKDGLIQLSPRTVQRERFSGESETRLHIEHWNPMLTKTSALKITAQAYAPGNESRAQQSKNKSTLVRAPMTGKVLSVPVNVGDHVEAGQTLVVIEAMKMENKISAPTAGIIAKVKAVAGQTITVGQEMVEFQ